MKVKCINDSHTPQLTSGQEYQVTNLVLSHPGNDYFYHLEGVLLHFMTNRFQIIDLEGVILQVRCDNPRDTLVKDQVYQVESLAGFHLDHFLVQGEKLSYVQNRFTPISLTMPAATTVAAPTPAAPVVAPTIPVDPPFDFQTYNNQLPRKPGAFSDSPLWRKHPLMPLTRKP